LVSKKTITGALVVALALFQVYTAVFGVLPGPTQRSIHWLFLSVLILLTRPLGGEKRHWSLAFVDYALIGVALVAGLYVPFNYETILERAGLVTQTDLVMGLLAILLVLEACRRELGWVLTGLATAFLLYPFVGPYLPGLLGHRGYDLERVTAQLFLGTDGIYGTALAVSATFIYLFMLLGAFFDQTGAGKFMVDLAFSLTGRVPGGPAQAAVLSSAMMGTISGSGVANVVTTGTFTIPLMIKTGYKNHFAGAVEAVASNGGQIMPPVMGAVAFLMAELIGVPYATIAKAAILPAILYFVAFALTVYFEARRSGLKGMSREELPKFWPVLKTGFLYLLPIVALIYFMVAGYSPMRAASFGLAALLIISLFKRDGGAAPSGLFNASHSAAMGARGIAAACAASGIIIGVLNLTGLALKLSTLIVTLSAGNLAIALILTMLVSLVLGMGLPTSAAYLVLAVLGGPALVKMGVPVLAAHMFILYFGCLSTITPPVALSAFAAAGIAKSNPFKTGFTAMRLATVAFLIPFMFVYDQSLLLIGTPLNVIHTIITAFSGSAILAVGLAGWLHRPLKLWERLVFGAASLLLIDPGLVTDVAGFGIAAVMYLVVRSTLSKSAEAVA
jgi:TRAP transporter 4TM/12TM fusion protein